MSEKKLFPKEQGGSSSCFAFAVPYTLPAGRSKQKSAVKTALFDAGKRMRKSEPLPANRRFAGKSSAMQIHTALLSRFAAAEGG